MTLSIIIPTYQREDVLLDTIRLLLEQEECADEILIVDQTPEHEVETEKQLKSWHESKTINWIRKSTPSITGAMNEGILKATSSHVLFLDDDIIPASNLIKSHKACYSDPSIWAVVGQVLQPGEEPSPSMMGSKKDSLSADLDFRFHSSGQTEIQNVMAGNLSIQRDRALEIGGFDENFIAVAYRFETDFAKRIVKAGGKILFSGDASIKHLRAERGGTRSYLNHLTSHKPDHSVGDYYFAMHHSQSSLSSLGYSTKRFFRSIRTKFHLTHPWWIPPKLVGEFRGWLLAKRLKNKGRKLIDDTK